VTPADPRTPPVLAVAARTDVGRRRELNEDTLFAADPCFLIADGMGGHERGDLASKAAISAFTEEFTSPGEATLERIERALHEARVRVRRIASVTEFGAGCTLTGLIRLQHEGIAHWYVVNIGDSRVYLQRGDTLSQLTVDHSLHEELLTHGDLHASAAPRNIITRALGSEDDRSDAWLLPLETGSRLLVCSDGLTTELSDAEVSSVLARAEHVSSVATELVHRAVEAGGRDNVSVIVVEVLDGGVPMPDSDADAADTATEPAVSEPPVTEPIDVTIPRSQ
jgi:serine/threonine protein phosphatase PrpC